MVTPASEASEVLERVSRILKEERDSHRLGHGRHRDEERGASRAYQRRSEVSVEIRPRAARVKSGVKTRGRQRDRDRHVIVHPILAHKRRQISVVDDRIGDNGQPDRNKFMEKVVGELLA